MVQQNNEYGIAGQWQISIPEASVLVITGVHSSYCGRTKLVYSGASLLVTVGDRNQKQDRSRLSFFVVVVVVLGRRVRVCFSSYDRH
jgi:hypothetical protein